MTMTRRVAYYCGQGARVLLFFYLLFCISSCGGGGGSTTSTPTGTVTGTVTLPANTNAKLFKAPQSFYARLFASPAHAEAVTDLTKLIVTASGATTNPNSSGKYTLTVSEGTNLELTVTAPSGNVVLQAIIPSVTAGSSTSQNVDSTSTAVALLWKSNTNLSLSQLQSLPAFTTVKNAVESALTDVVVDSISANTSVTSAVQTAVTPALTTITLSPSSVTLISGTSQTFTATGLDQYGNILSFTPTLSVTPSGLGSITSSGAFTALKTGTGTITVTGGGISASAAVTVTTGALNSLVISPTSVTLYKNDTQQFTVYGTDTNGNAKERKFITVSPTWSVTGSIGTIASSGLFTASAQGTGQVKSEATKDDGTKTSITADVTVANRNPVVSVTTANPSTLTPGQTSVLSVTASDADGDSLSYTWSAKSGTISGTGSSVTYTVPSTEGTCTVTVTVSDGNGGSVGTTVINRNPVISSGPSVSDSSMLVNNIFPLSVTTSDLDGDTLSYAWSSTGGTISGSGLSVTYTAPSSPGTYTISITISDSNGGSASGSTNVTVTSFTAKQASVGADHTCALMTSGGVKCWGNNSYGQLGNGTTTKSSTPVDVTGLSSGVSAIAAGSGCTCVLMVSGGVKCWGNNVSGQLGDGTITNRYAPVDVVGMTSGVSAVSTGSGYACAVTTGGGVKCWGSNISGQLGNGTTTDSAVPMEVTGFSSGVSAITAGGSHACALTSSGGVKCWGSNANLQLGNVANGLCSVAGYYRCSTIPVDVTGLSSGVSAIAAGGEHTCALTSSGGVKCWGLHMLGQLGVGNGNGLETCWYDNIYSQCSYTKTPLDVSGLTSGVTAIAAEFNNTCVLTSSGGVKCWGDNGGGQLGIGITAGPELCYTNKYPDSCSRTPVDVSSLSSSSGVIGIGGAGYHTCALDTSGGIKCWGSNTYGQLGNGTASSSSTPVSVVGFGG